MAEMPILLVGFPILCARGSGADGRHPLRTKATVTMRAYDQVHSATATGHGLLNALHSCLRTCLAKQYPQIRDVHLTNYKVRLLDAHKGKAAKVRVLIEWTDTHDKWTTVGVSDNVIEASWNALLDAMRLELLRVTEKDSSFERSPKAAANVTERSDESEELCLVFTGLE
jgi:2-isopropylmalate synthase